ncbi:MAG: hypothetical protein HYS15_03325 [Candidatus Spechtbacteria bacterium]|nr:hypothetical protein [Candidatus Spechtbacteria bacterium]
MKSENIRKKKLYLGAIVFLLPLVFGYGVYFVMGRVSVSQEQYIAKQKELVSLEHKQREVAALEQEFTGLEAQRSIIFSSLLSQQYEDKLRFIIEIEDIAKTLGLVYDFTIQREVTKEDIQREKEELARVRRGEAGQKAVKEEEKLPEITVGVKLEGKYAQVVKFLEKFQSLSYYTEIQSLDISKQKTEEGSSRAGVEAVIQASVFTRE